MPAELPEKWAQIGMRIALRDIQDYVGAHTHPVTGQLDSLPLQAYLYALLITAGGFEDDGEG